MSQLIKYLFLVQFLFSTVKSSKFRRNLGNKKHGWKNLKKQDTETVTVNIKKNILY